MTDLPDRMRAVVHRTYGTPDALALEEVAVPLAGEGEVLVRMEATATSIGDTHVISGKPYLMRLMGFGVLRPKHLVPGMALAGRVAALGANVTDFAVGDEVYGEILHGTFAEYAAAPARLLAPIPEGSSFEAAAALPWGMTALQGLRDVAGVRPGQHVLVNGASGGVGTYAVQIAKELGAHVTGVCSSRNVALVRALGADEVVDYRKEDFTSGGERFDAMLDMVGNRSLADCRSVLKPGGIYVAGAGGDMGDWIGPITWMLGVALGSLTGNRKLKTFLNQPKRDDLLVLNELVAKGAVKPVIDRSFRLNEIPEALRYVKQGHARGKVVIAIR